MVLGGCLIVQIIVQIIIVQSSVLAFAQQDSANVRKQSSSAISATVETAKTTRFEPELFGALQGMIVDRASGKAVSGVLITFTDLEGDLSALLSTPPSDSSRTDGEVRLLNLHPSRYSMECTAVGFKRFSREFLVVIVVGAPTRFRVELERE
jgi:hypothetical protein